MKTIKNVLLMFYLTGVVTGAVQAQMLYWVEANSKLSCASLDGSNQSSLSLPAQSFPHGITADKNGIVWTDVAFGGKLTATGLNISSPGTALDSGCAFRDAAIDTNGDIYWISTNLITGPAISKVKRDGTGKTTIQTFPASGNNVPFGLAIDPKNRSLYWTDFNEGTIVKSGLTPFSSQTVICSGLSGPMGIVIDTASGFLYWTEFNSGQIVRSDLSGQNKTVLINYFNNPSYIALDSKRGRIYWTEFGSSIIRSATTSGTNVTKFPVSVVNPIGIKLLSVEQSISFNLGSDSIKTYGDGLFTLIATATSGQPVIFSSSDTSIASVTGSTVTIRKAGTVIITASCASYLHYEAAPDIQQRLTINKKAVTVTGVSAQDKVYDGTVTATLTGGTLTGVISGDSVTLISGSGVFSDKDTGTAKTVTASELALGGKDAENYSLSQPSGLSADITPKAITVTGLSAQDKVYDGTDTATLTGGTLTGVISGDNVTLTSGSGVFSDKNAGTAKTVTVSGFALEGKDAENYSLLQPSGLSADITPKAITVTGLSAQDKVYDRTVTATLIGGTLTGVISGDSVALISGSGVFSDKNAGTAKTITASGFALGGKDAENYSLSQPSGLSADITPKAITVTGVNAQNKVYDGTVTAIFTGGTLTGVIPGDSVTLISGSGVFSDKNTGTAKTVTASGFALEGKDAKNYSLSQPAGLSADITPKAITVTGISAQDKVYDGTDAATLIGGTLTGVISGDSVTLISGSGVFSDKNAGNAKTVTASGFALSGKDAKNYSLSQPAGLSADITPALLVISANNVKKSKNMADPQFTVTWSGFVAGEDQSVVSGLDITREPGEEFGIYSIIVSGATARNYQIVFQNGTLTIEPPTSVRSSTVVKQKDDDFGIFIKKNPVSLSSRNAVFTIKCFAGYIIDVIIYDAVGTAVYSNQLKTDRNGLAGFNWNLINRKNHPVHSGTYLVVARAKNFSGATVRVLKTKLGIKQ